MTDHTVGATSANHVGEALSDYVNGDLSDSDRTVVETHLRECPRCEADLRTLRLSVNAVKRLPMAPVPRAFALPATARANTPVTSFLNWSTRALAAALVLFLAISLVRPIIAPEMAGGPLPGNAPSDVPLPPQLAKVPPSDALKRAAAAQQAARATSFARGQTTAATPSVAAVPGRPAGPAASGAAPAAAPAAPPAPASQAPAAQDKTSSSPNTSAAVQSAQGGAVSARAAAPGQSPLAAAAPAGVTPVITPPPAGTGYPGPEATIIIPTPPVLGEYPFAESVGQPVTPAPNDGSAPVEPTFPPAPTPIVVPHPVNAGPTTWFTPALVLLLLLAVVSAIAMSWLGRRGR